MTEKIMSEQTDSPSRSRNKQCVALLDQLEQAEESE